MFKNINTNADRLASIVLRKVQKHLTLALNVLTYSTRSRIICDFLSIAPVWKSKPHRSCKWVRSEEEEILLNSEGVVSDSGFGFGGLLHNRTGNPILCYSGKEGSDSVTEQELRGIKANLVATKFMGITKIAIASDSQLAVNTVEGE